MKIISINNTGDNLSFRSIRYLSSQNFIPDKEFLKHFEIKNVDPELRNVIENAPLLKKLGEKTDIYVSHYRQKNSDIHTLEVNFIEEHKSGRISYESIKLSHKDTSDSSFFQRISTIFKYLTDNFDNFKSNNAIDTIMLKNQNQLIFFEHHSDIRFNK